jgi:hypothetical protein
MKKIILSILAVAAFGTANAQEESTVNGFSKGDKFVEGSFSFRSGDFEDSWAFNPSMGYMLDDKWAVGGRLNFGGSKDNNTNDKESVLGITGFARYYFLSLGETKSFQAFGEAGLGYSAITEDPNVGDKSTDNTLNANISIGIEATYKLKLICLTTFLLNHNSDYYTNGNLIF